MADSPSSPVAVCFRCRRPIAAAEYRFAERTLEEMAAVVGVPESERPDWVALQSPVCPTCLELQRVWRLKATVEVAPAERTGPLPAESVPPAAPPRRPWWKRKPTWVAVILLLGFAYPLSLGPLNYFGQRGWLPRWSLDAFEVLYEPLDQLNATHAWINERVGLNAYLRWWITLGQRHRAASD